MNNSQYNRLLTLKTLINNKQATKNQKNEYMEILYKNGNITQEQYSKYLADQNTDEIANAALTIGGIILAVWLISKLTDK